METPKAGPSGVNPKRIEAPTPGHTVAVPKKTVDETKGLSPVLQELTYAESTGEILARCMDEIKRLVPLQSTTISVADRKTVHQNIDKVFRQLGMLEGACAAVNLLHMQEQTRNEQLKVSVAIAEERRKSAEGKILLHAGSIVPAHSSAGTSEGRRVLSYAEKAAARPTTYKLRIESDKKDQTFDETKKQLQGAINPRHGQLEVMSVSKAKGGAVIVECASQRDCDRITEAIAAKTALKSATVAKHKPRIMLSSVPKGFEHKEICESLYEQNRFVREGYGSFEDLKDDLTVLTTLKRGASDSEGMILEVSPALRRLLVGQTLSVDWCRCRVSDYISLLQCFRCFSLGHKAADCKQKEDLCRRCGAAGHKAASCNGKPSCAVCKHENVKEKSVEKRCKTDHCSKATECPTMKRIHEAISKTIDYHG